MNLIFLMMAASWLRLETPHFEVLTDTNERTAREVLERLERIRQAFGHEKLNPLPVRVYLFRSEKEFQPFRPSGVTAGFYQSGPERDIIVMHNGSDTSHVVFHEYVHLALHHSSAKLPMWFEEGLAEFYSTIETYGAKLRVGRPVGSHVRRLADSRWLTAEEMWSTNKASPNYNEREKVGIFYAESWALVHMLNIAPEYRKNLQAFASLIEDGVPGRAAFEKAFGRTMDRALRDLRTIVDERIFLSQDLAWEPSASPVPMQRALTKEEAELLRGELYLALGRVDEAGAIYESLSHGKPVNAAVETGLGAVAMSLGAYDKARRHLERAISLGSKDASTHFEYAMLLRDTGAPRERIEEFLNKTIALNPIHVEAHFILATMLSTEGRHEEAIGHLKKAVDVLPRQSSFWHALGIAYLESGRRELARGAAKRAADCAATPQEEDMAAGLARMVEQRGKL